MDRAEKELERRAQASDSRQGSNITWVGVWVNAVLIALKFLAGFFGRSQALLADAVHSLSDLFTDAVVLLGLKTGRKEADARHHFGHARIETLASAVVGISLLVVAGYIGYRAGLDIYFHRETHPTWLALAAAVLSLVAKEALYRFTVRVGRRIKSPAVIANAWHHRSDALSSVAVFVGLLGAQVRPDWHILDAYAALLVAVLIFKVGLEVLITAVKEMTDAAPGPEAMAAIESCIASVEGVRGHHDLKVRSSGGIYQIQVHIAVQGNLAVSQGHQIAKAVEACLLGDIAEAGDVIVHVDPAAEDQMPPQGPVSNA